MLSYTAETSNKSNVIKATAEDDVSVDVTLTNANHSNTPVTNGAAVTWSAGENVLTFTVKAENAAVTTYTVTVNKS